MKTVFLFKLAVTKRLFLNQDISTLEVYIFYIAFFALVKSFVMHRPLFAPVVIIIETQSLFEYLLLLLANRKNLFSILKYWSLCNHGSK